MAPYLPPTPETASVKYNHFHEYDDNNEELFEIRELTPQPPSLSPANDSADPNLSPTRVGKFKNVIKRVAIPLPRGLQSPKRAPTRYVPEGGDAELWRTTSESWEEHVQDMRDEMFGTGKYYCPPDPSKLYEFEDPEHFRYPDIRRAKTVRWGSSARRITKIDEIIFEKDDNAQEKQSEMKTSDDKRNGNQTCEVESEQPTPEIVHNGTKNENANPISSGFITIDLSNLPSANFHRDSITNSHSCASGKPKSASITNEEVPLQDPSVDIKKTCSFDSATCHSLCPQKISPGEIRQILGSEAMDVIAKELNSRFGKPLPLPPRDPSQNPSEVLALRESTVIFTYALWAATFLFQRLIVAIKLSLNDFKPNHQGILCFELHDYQVFRNVDVKTRFLILQQMKVIFDEHVRLLQKKTPQDAFLRQKMIGQPFWAEGQVYRFKSTGEFSGVFLHYRIKRGGVKAKEDGILETMTQ